MSSSPDHDEDPFDWVGATIDGKYRVDEVVGEGGFAVVYKGHHLGFDEPVAIKCLKLPTTLTDEDRGTFLQTFVTEGRLLHKLSKSTAGIVQCLDVGAATSPGGTWTPFLVLEWLEGITLHRALRDRTKAGKSGRPIAEGIALLDSAARALATAHEQGVAHRDVKPANLYFADVGGRATLKVVDFGIAKVLSEGDIATKVLEASGGNGAAFTPRYAAPEQFTRSYGPTGPWTDVFAFALVLVEVVSGKQALDGDDAPQIYLSSCDLKRRPTLRALGVGVADEVEAILAKALAVDPRRRYASLGELWEALTTAVPESAVARYSERPRVAAKAVMEQVLELTTADLAPESAPSTSAGSAASIRMKAARPLTVRRVLGGVALGVGVAALGLGLFVRQTAPESAVAAGAKAPDATIVAASSRVRIPPRPLASPSDRDAKVEKVVHPVTGAKPVVFDASARPGR